MSLASNVKSKYLWRVAIIAFIVATVALLPSVIMGRGMLLMSDDFTYQQQLFNVYYGDLYKSGNLFGWSWYTDLGSGTASSYSFYNLFSPFTLLFAFLPSSVIPYMTAPLLVLKYVVAAVLAFIFIQKFANSRDAALFGALLYAFSGLQTINLIFPFHDATAIFPLLLIGIEDAANEENTRNGIFRGTGVLAIAVFLLAVTNYYLFFGQVVFAIIYYLFRFAFKKNPKGFLRCLLGGVLGTLAAGIVLVPSALAVLSNPRVGGLCSEGLFDWSRYLTILQAYFMPTDVMGMRNAFLQHECSSCALTLPFVAMALVFAYIYNNKKSRLTWLTITLILMSGIPILNSVFSMLNAHYYARWFYMPALIFALASALAIDDPKTLRKTLRIGSAFNICCTVLTAFVSMLAWFLFWIKGKTYITEQVNLPVILTIFALGIIFSVATYLICRHANSIVTSLTVCVIVVATVTTGVAAIRYSTGVGTVEQYVKGVSNSEGQLGFGEAKDMLTDYARRVNEKLPDDQNYRIRTDNYEAGIDYFANSYDNVSVLLKKPSVNSFISTVDGGIFELYNTLGIGRDVITKGDFSDELMLLLSCKYHVVKDDVSEYETFLPLGFAYDKYVTTTEFNSIPTEDRAFALLNFIVTDEKTGLEHGNVKTLEKDLTALTERDKSSKFTRTGKGFTAEITATKNEVVFFSVPYSDGFSATVNGKQTEIISDCGLMAIPVSEGENVIEFTYKTPGLKTGAIMSIVGIVMICALYIADFIIIRRRVRGRF